MKQYYRLLVPLILFAAILLAACGPEPTALPRPAATVPLPTPAATEPTGGDVIHGQAVVEETDILILESFPVQVNVVARGYLPDGCTEIDEIQQERAGQTFQVTITTVRPADAVCTEAIVPFEQVVGLDVAGLEAGTYTVDVNGVADTFTLAVDNVMPGGPFDSPFTSPIIVLPNPDLPVLTWHREGGLAGFCDDLAIDVYGLVDAAPCAGGPSQTVAHGPLDAGDQALLQGWLTRYRSFEVEQIDQAPADAMTIRLTFAGIGKEEPGEMEKRAILEFAAETYAAFAGIE